MSDNVKRELLWLLPTVLLSMVVLYMLSWQTGWELRPGQELEIVVHDSYYVFPFAPVAIYVFTYILMLVYTIRQVLINFSLRKLNMIMLVVYGYVAFANYSMAHMLPMFQLLFYALMATSIVLAIASVGILIVRAVKPKY